jgi:hypothetical protein
MDIKQVLLTDEEVVELLSTIYFKDKFEVVKTVNKAQCLKLIEWLEDCHRISHVEVWAWEECQDCKAGGTCGHSHSGGYEHKKSDCWLCKLKKDLGGE